MSKSASASSSSSSSSSASASSEAFLSSIAAAISVFNSLPAAERPRAARKLSAAVGQIAKGSHARSHKHSHKHAHKRPHSHKHARGHVRFSSSDSDSDSTSGSDSDYASDSDAEIAFEAPASSNSKKARKAAPATSAASDSAASASDSAPKPKKSTAYMVFAASVRKDATAEAKAEVEDMPDTADLNTKERNIRLFNAANAKIRALWNAEKDSALAQAAQTVDQQHAEQQPPLTDSERNKLIEKTAAQILDNKWIVSAVSSGLDDSVVGDA